MVVKRLIGFEASNMKNICKDAGGSKVRIRGKGAEEKGGEEASEEPLHIMICATSRSRFQRAKQLVQALVKRIQQEYAQHCCERGLPLPIFLVSCNVSSLA